MNLIKVKAILAKEFHIQPSEIDSMPVWEYELFLKEINNAVKEENERNKQEETGGQYKDYQKMANPNYIKSMQGNFMPKMPSISMPKMPSMSGV